MNQFSHLWVVHFKDFFSRPADSPVSWCSSIRACKHVLCAITNDAIWSYNNTKLNFFSAPAAQRKKKEAKSEYVIWIWVASHTCWWGYWVDTIKMWPHHVYTPILTCTIRIYYTIYIICITANGFLLPCLLLLLFSAFFFFFFGADKSRQHT